MCSQFIYSCVCRDYFIYSSFEIFGSFNSNANSHTNGPITRDMVNREIEKTKKEDYATSTETSSNKALHTIKEFKIHNLKSNEDEE